MKVSALILAGGRGTRMGRVDKGLQPFRGGTLASHVLQRLAPQVASVTLNAANEIAVAAFLEGRIGFPDIPRVVEQALENHDGGGEDEAGPSSLR